MPPQTLSPSAVSQLTRHYTRILRLFPPDPIRPAAVQFTRALEWRLRRLGAPVPPAAGFSADAPKQTLPPPQQQSQNPGPAPAPAPSSERVDPKAELLAVNALYTLLENRYASKYQLPPSYLRPRSNPSHYEDIIAETERVARGERAGWWERLRRRFRWS